MIHKNTESGLHKNRENLTHPFFTTCFFPGVTLIHEFRHAACTCGTSVGCVDPDACRIGPRLVTASRRHRVLKTKCFTSFNDRATCSAPGRQQPCCAHQTFTPFSFGAPQALTLVGHNSAQSRRATTDRSGLIAMVPAACLPPARSLRTDTTRSKSSVDDCHPARLFRATLLYPGPSRSETDQNRNRPPP